MKTCALCKEICIRCYNESENHPPFYNYEWKSGFIFCPAEYVNDCPYHLEHMLVMQGESAQ